MSTAEVRSTPEAIAAIDQMSTLLGGDFLTSLNTLIQLGNDLSNGEMWRGRYANDFTTQWSTIQTKLRESHTGLVELNTLVQRINQDIMAAGGNS
jgi:hypothetical protein